MDAYKSVEDLEMALLLEAIYQRFGNDFRNYKKEILRHKLSGFMCAHSIATFSILQDKVLHHAGFINQLLRDLDIRPTELFACPEQVLNMRKVLVPWLRSCPEPKIWIAESTVVEDVYAIAILLREEDLQYKTQLYVTGPNANLLAEARHGNFSATIFAQYEENYLLSGGMGSLLDYCEKTSDLAVFNPELQDNITWAHYNLSTDTSFNEFDVILCCGGLSDYNSQLRRRALQVFCDSQPRLGMLVLMGNNIINGSLYTSQYRFISAEHGVYQRAGDAHNIC